MSTELVEILETGEILQPHWTRAAVPSMPAFSGGLYGQFLAELDASQKTKETYTRNLKQFFIWLNERGITQPTRDHVIAFRDEIKETRKPTTAQNYLAVVRVFFKWAEAVGIYPDIARSVKGVKLNKSHKKDYLGEHQVKRVLKSFDRDTLQGCRDFALFALLVTCGLRTIEAVRANIEDLRPGPECARLFVQGKGQEEKTPVNIPAELEDLLRDYLAKRGKVEKTEPLFASIGNKNQGGRMTTRSVSRIVKEAMRGAGYDSEMLTAHSLRHTAVTTALLNGKSTKEVQGMARHAKADTTDIYNHAINEAANDCTRVNARVLLSGL